MTCSPTFAARSASFSPTRRFRSSDSTTQGPAIRKGEPPPPKCCGMSVAAAGELRRPLRGYFVEAIVRIGFSVYQVLAVLSCIVFVTVIDILMARGAQSLGAIRWGKMPPRSQYALFILAVTFTWLMGLMGFA